MIVALAVDPTWPVTLDGLADMEKSATLTETTTLLVTVPFEPDNVTVYAPVVDELSVHVEAALATVDDNVTLEGLHEVESPVDGLDELDTAIVPE